MQRFRSDVILKKLRAWSRLLQEAKSIAACLVVEHFVSNLCCTYRWQKHESESCAVITRRGTFRSFSIQIARQRNQFCAGKLRNKCEKIERGWRRFGKPVTCGEDMLFFLSERGETWSWFYTVIVKWLQPQTHGIFSNFRWLCIFRLFLV